VQGAGRLTKGHGIAPALLDDSIQFAGIVWPVFFQLPFTFNYACLFLYPRDFETGMVPTAKWRQRTLARNGKPIYQPLMLFIATRECLKTTLLT
jgi:hypothetical protein